MLQFYFARGHTNTERGIAVKLLKAFITNATINNIDSWTRLLLSSEPRTKTIECSFY